MRTDIEITATEWLMEERQSRMWRDPDEDRAYLLRDPDEVRAREARLRLWYMAPLTAYVRGLKAALGPDKVVLWFDPWDGGIEAQILMLLEAPGGKAVGSGFISMNNPDPSARFVHQTVEDVGLDRYKLVAWNVVPWYVGNEERSRIRAVNSEERTQGVRLLEGLLPLLPRLRVVLTLGTHAQDGWRTIASSHPTIVHVEGPHPSATNMNSRPQNRQKFVEALERARDLADGPALS